MPWKRSLNSVNEFCEGNVFGDTGSIYGLLPYLTFLSLGCSSVLDVMVGGERFGWRKGVTVLHRAQRLTVYFEVGILATFVVNSVTEFWNRYVLNDTGGTC